MKRILKTILQTVLLPLAVITVALETLLDKVGNLGSLGYGVEHYFKNKI